MLVGCLRMLGNVGLAGLDYGVVRHLGAGFGGPTEMLFGVLKMLEMLASVLVVVFEDVGNVE